MGLPVWKMLGVRRASEITTQKCEHGQQRQEESNRMMWVFGAICFTIVAWPSYHCGYKNGWKDGRNAQWGIPKKRSWWQ